MATSATNMSNFNYYQNGKHGTLPHNMQKDMEVSQDMHLKMSKKIAQLTKVIYALNTKNDEHEAIIQNIREKHEEEIQQVYAETRTKVELYKQKINDESSYMQKVEALQRCIQDHEREKEKALGEFEKIKQDSAQREAELQARHSEKMLEMSQEVLTAKKEFEARLNWLDSLKDEADSKRDSELKELEAKHALELDDLRSSLRAEQDNLSSTKDQVESKLKSDLERLQMDIARLSSEKKQMCEDYEGKLSKAQAFYDKELEVLRNAQVASGEEKLAALQEQYDQLKKDSQYAESQHQKRMDDMLKEIVLKEEETEKVRAELQKLQNLLQDTSSNSSMLNKQLSEAHSAASQALTRLKEVEGELIASRERCEQQAQELVKKSTLLGELEATKLQHEATITDLRSQLEKVRDRVSWLEGTKRALESHTQAQTDETTGQIRALQQSLEDLSVEKQKQREQYERDIAALKQSSSADRDKLVEGHRVTVETLTTDYEDRLGAVTREGEGRLAEAKQELESRLEEARSSHRAELLASQDEYERTQTDLTARLNSTTDELRRLKKAVEESEQGLGSATSQLTSLREAADRLRAELEQARAELRAANGRLATVQADYATLKVTHESSMSAAQVELKTRLEKLAIDLDNKWKDTLRKECQKLRQEITEQKDEDKRAAMDQLTRLKDEQHSGAKQAWEGKVQELLGEISVLRSQLDAHEQTSSVELDRLRGAAESETRRLTAELAAAGEEYKRKISELEATYEGQLRELRGQSDGDRQALESRLRGEHLEQMRVTSMAHKSALSCQQEDAEKRRQSDLDELRAKHGQRTESLRTELDHKHSIEMEQISRDHQQQLYAARMELDRALELSKQKDGEHAMKYSDLEDQIRHRESSIRGLETEVKRLQRGVDELRAELDAKGHEILRVRSEAHSQAKAREDSLQAGHRDELDHLHSDHLQETQDMLAEFTKAQEILKDRIAELQIMLEEAEDRYRHREARPEDVRLITELQAAVREREDAVRRVLDDKKFYQMELVNRETNFNKVFSTAPNVGVLNPLHKKPKKNEPAPMKFSSSPALSNRLDPLPGSPLHDGSFNHMRPLPPATKKFVR